MVCLQVICKQLLYGYWVGHFEETQHSSLLREMTQFYTDIPQTAFQSWEERTKKLIIHQRWKIL